MFRLNFSQHVTESHVNVVGRLFWQQLGVCVQIGGCRTIRRRAKWPSGYFSVEVKSVKLTFNRQPRPGPAIVANGQRGSVLVIIIDCAYRQLEPCPTLRRDLANRYRSPDLCLFAGHQCRVPCLLPGR